jgi:membrane protease subunit HflK
MDSNTQRSLAVSWAAMTIGGAVGLATSWSAQNATGLVGAAFAGVGMVILTLSVLQSRLRAMEDNERRDFEDLRNRRPETALFSGRDETFRARSSRMAFERWVIPAFALMLGVGQAAAAAWLWRWLDRGPAILPERSALSMAFYGLLALVTFLLGRFDAGLSQDPRHRLLRPAASRLLLAAILFTLAIAAAAAAWSGYPEIDRRVARALVVFLGLLGAESLVLLILEAYRPRQRRQDSHPLYESRILGLLGQPGGLVSSAAQALDYQFGFKVSETWFYRWLERALAGLILLQAAVLWIASAIVIVDPHEQATIERWGRRLETRGVLEPGLHFKWPWPLEVVRLFSTREARAFNVGFVPDPKLDAERTLVWTRPHYKEEFNLLVASRESTGDSTTNGPGSEASVPVNLLTASIPIQYHVTNVLDWGYRHADPGLLLERLATREVVHYLVGVDLEAIMSTGRLEAARELRDAIQESAVEQRLGVEILFVGLQDIHPPVQVAAAYEAVIGATQERETRILDAQGYRAQRVPLAEAESARRVQEAASDRILQTARAAGAAGRFTNQMAAFAASPAVFARRSFLETVVQGTATARKYVLTTTNLSEDYWINLEDKLRPDLLDVTMPTTRAESPKP